MARKKQASTHGANQQVNQSLCMPITEAYRPSLPIYSMRSQAVLGTEFYQDVEVMRMHDAIKLPFQWVMSSMAHAEWEMKASDLESAQYAGDLLLWWWNNAMYQAYEEGGHYGWAAGEVVYKSADGVLKFDKIIPYSSRDVCPIVHPKTRRLISVQVISQLGGTRRLWSNRPNIPNKAYWYVHRPRYGGALFGESMVRPAWKPWRDLAGIDGTEENLSLASYRGAVGYIKVWHPEGNFNGTNGVSVPKFATSGGAVSNSDIARNIGETMKAGASIALTSESYPAQVGGGKKWDVEIMNFNPNIDQLLLRESNLVNKCSRAIGVPPELIQAAETGSGYSGRSIPLQGFLTSQQRSLHDMTTQVMNQLINPMIKYCLGEERWASATPKPLIQTYRKVAWDQDGGQGQSQQDAASSGGQPPFASGGQQAGQSQGA